MSEPLIRKVRMALQEASGNGSGLPGALPVLRRDIGRLLLRLERLRSHFPGAPELADRVRLSPHVMGLLEEARAPYLRADGALLLDGGSGR